MAAADAEIERTYKIMDAIDKLTEELDKVHNVREIVGRYRQRIEAIDQRLR
jgi:hypothetical protein